MNQKPGIIAVHPVQADRSENTFAEYVDICRRHVWLIVILAVGSAIIAGVWSFNQTPVYSAKATIVIEQETPGALEKDRYRPADTAPEYFQTHFELIVEKLRHPRKEHDGDEVRAHESAHENQNCRRIPYHAQKLAHGQRCSGSIDGAANRFLQQAEQCPAKENS